MEDARPLYDRMKLLRLTRRQWWAPTSYKLTALSLTLVSKKFTGATTFNFSAINASPFKKLAVANR